MTNLLFSALAVTSLASSSVATDPVPSLTASIVGVSNNISCRTKARAKYFEVGARDMSGPEDNAQWGTVGSMKALVWCRDTQAVIIVGGQSVGGINELRDELKRAF